MDLSNFDKSLFSTYSSGIITEKEISSWALDFTDQTRSETKISPEKNFKRLILLPNIFILLIIYLSTKLYTLIYIRFSNENIIL